MNIQTIAEHQIDLDLLPESANVLDLGCRGFIFANELRRLGHSVFCVDCDDIHSEKHFYHRFAITDYNGWTKVIRSNDPQATKISMYGDDSNPAVPCITLKAFSDIVDVPFWDYIKTDIEGSEKEMIMSLEKAPAKQLEIEFHLHTGIYNNEAVDIMVDRLKILGYEVASHQKTSQHGLMPNYWSSLFILKQ